MRTNNYQKIYKRYIAVVLALSLFVSGIVVWQLRLIGKASTQASENPQSNGLSSFLNGSIDKQDGDRFEFESDVGTSNLEAVFDAENDYNQQKRNDGRILTDKSVKYLDSNSSDDYNVFTGGEETFAVTLSALAQDYTINKQGTVAQPVDVVFILDTSLSMYENATNPTYGAGGGTTSKLHNSINAINSIANQLMNENTANRFGVVSFSDGADNILEVGHYLPNDNGVFLEAYMSSGNNSDYGSSFRQSNSPVIDKAYIRTAIGVTMVDDDNQEIEVQQKYGSNMYNFAATWTQKGFYEANKLLERSSLSKDITMEVGDTGVYLGLTRKPIVILLTDGLPTLSSPTYDNLDNATCYGTGSHEVDIHGYYTIQTANYIKNNVNELYEETSEIYTLGMGVAGDYAKAVLNPNQNNIAALPNTGYHAYYDETYGYYYYRPTDPPTRLKDYYTYSDYYNLHYESNSGFLLKKMLNNDPCIASGYYTGPHSSYIGTTLVPGISVSYYYEPTSNNPLSDYSYADNSWIGNFTANDIIQRISGVLESNTVSVNLPYLFENKTDLQIKDVIGMGMTVKSEVPKLAYGSEVYIMTAQTPIETQQNNNTVITTRYIVSDNSAVYSDASDSKGNRSLKLYYQNEDNPGITAIKTKITDASGKIIEESMEMIIPTYLMPAYFPNKAFTSYYKMAPARLIYTVGTEQSITDILDKMAPQDSPLNYYTNQSAFSTFTVADKNLYYSKHKTDDLNKGVQKVSGSEEYIRKLSTNGNIVIQDLGNNGLVRIIKQDNLRINLEKVWNDYKTEHDGVEIKLYQKASNSEEAFVYGENGSYAPYNQSNGTTILNDDNEWKHLFILPKSGLVSGETVTYSYYIEETPVSRYSTNYRLGSSTGSLLQQTSIKVNGNNKTVLPLDKDMSVFIINSFEYEMPSTGGTGIFPLLLLGFVLVTIGVIYIKYYGFNIKKGEKSNYHISKINK